MKQRICAAAVLALLAPLAGGQTSPQEVRVHRKLRQAGVEAVLQVYEGQSHAHYYRDVSAPETREAFTEIAQFFDKHLAR
jgi:acetyl esterase/lipase